MGQLQRLKSHRHSWKERFKSEKLIINKESREILLLIVSWAQFCNPTINHIILLKRHCLQQCVQINNKKLANMQTTKSFSTLQQILLNTLFHFPEIEQLWVFWPTTGWTSKTITSR